MIYTVDIRGAFTKSEFMVVDTSFTHLDLKIIKDVAPCLILQDPLIHIPDLQGE